MCNPLWLTRLRIPTNSVVFFPTPFPHRHGVDHGQRDDADRGQYPRALRHLGHQRAPLLPDPPHGPHGPQGRHLETPWLRRLGSQTGGGQLWMDVGGRFRNVWWGDGGVGGGK